MIHVMKDSLMALILESYFVEVACDKLGETYRFCWVKKMSEDLVLHIDVFACNTSNLWHIHFFKASLYLWIYDIYWSSIIGCEDAAQMQQSLYYWKFVILLKNYMISFSKNMGRGYPSNHRWIWDRYIPSIRYIPYLFVSGMARLWLSWLNQISCIIKLVELTLNQIRLNEPYFNKILRKWWFM